jgi:hypothetical protein
VLHPVVANALRGGERIYGAILRARLSNVSDAGHVLKRG